MGLRPKALFVVATVFGASNFFAQTTLLQKAQSAFRAAQQAEATLNEKSAADRTRADYLKLINEYQRVYLITPHTSYADDAMMAMSRLYEEINDPSNALKTLTFLVREYPASPFRREAERTIERLGGTAAAPKPTVATETKSGDGITVENIRYWEAPNSVRVVVDVDGIVTFKQGEARSPDRVFVDVSPARLSPTLIGKEWPVKNGLLQKIRVGQFDTSTVRIVLDLVAMRKVTSFLLKDPDRLIIDALGNATSAAPPTRAAPPIARAEPPKTDSTSALAPIIPPSPASATPKAETTPTDTKTPAPKAADEPKLVVTPARPTDRGNQSLVRSLGLKVSRVVIDAGHGGHDTGSIGPTGYAEKELVLDVAQRLKILIESELDAEVVMTRNDDTFVPLEARTGIANQQEADLFISIHANSSRTRSVRGVETYFLGLTTARDALETAARENAASERSIHELQDVVKKIMTQDKVDESRELARHIQSAMVGPKESGTNRGIKQAHFVVLIGAQMPSVLAEINFITNPQEERLLKTPKHRQQIAESLLGGVKSYSNTLSGVKTAKSQGK